MDFALIAVNARRNHQKITRNRNAEQEMADLYDQLYSILHSLKSRKLKTTTSRKLEIAIDSNTKV